VVAVVALKVRVIKEATTTTAMAGWELPLLLLGQASVTLVVAVVVRRLARRVLAVLEVEVQGIRRQILELLGRQTLAAAAAVLVGVEQIPLAALAVLES